MEDGSFTVVLTPVQMYAVLTGNTITAGEMLQNTWHGLPSLSSLQRYLAPMPQPSNYPQAWVNAHSHFPRRTGPECWIPPSNPLSEANLNRIFGGIELFGSTFTLVGGVVMILAPEPTLLSKPAGTILALHSADSMQAAIRQLYTGKRVTDFTQQGGTWAARRMGASPRTANLVGVVLDVAVPVGAGFAEGAARVIAIRAGRIITIEDAISGRSGRVSISDQEELLDPNGNIVREGGHTLKKHVRIRAADVLARAKKSSRGFSSAFSSERDANEALNAALKAYRSQIRSFILNKGNGPSTYSTQFVKNMDHSIGYGFSNGSNTPELLSKVNLVIARSSVRGKLLYVLTCYPVQ